ncbi:ABC transporter permease/M1 family aminopeptidase [Pontibacter indicus]|uniref:Peptidase family M1 n=1 Tax=Pontibacter indicus TaxID=1317125 RepID=A0A1R3WTU0_9BACT|nr:hypothetical protein [Pontibacter indicus]SIT81835.1 Peptidase family M1 [Pontibacter indicus]
MIRWKIFCFEFAYLVRRTFTWLCLALLLAFTFGMNQVISPGDGVYPNNTFLVTALTVLGGLLWLMMGASIAGQAAARDAQARIHPLIYTTPVSKLDYLGGKFLAALAVNALLVLSLPVGILLFFYLPGREHGELLPFRPWVYLNVYFLIALPTVFVATALQFTFAALSHRVMTSYLASLLLAIFPQLIAMSAATLLGNWSWAALLDPIGVAGIVGGEMQTWTAPDKNTRLMALEGVFLLNRICWLAAAAGILWLAYRRYGFVHPVTNSRWPRLKRRSKAQTEAPAKGATGGAASITVPQVQRSFGFATRFWQLLAMTRASFGMIARNPVGLTLVGAIALASAVFGAFIMKENGVPLLSTTQQVIGCLAAPVGNVSSPWVVIPLLILYFAGELVWRERDAGLGDVADAAPVPDWVLFMGKFMGLGLIILAWLGLLMTGGIGMQFILGYDKLEPGLYVKALFGLQLIDYLLFALLALVVHVVVNQKHIAYLVLLFVFCFMAFPSRFGVEHPLLIYGADPGWWYTDMRGFGPTLGPWLWFKLYWTAWALLLLVGGRLLWVRGREQSLKHRLRVAPRRIKRSTVWVTVIGTGLLLTTGSFIFYNTNVLNAYHTEADGLEWEAEYERRYGRYNQSPQPQLTATKLQVELYPDQQEVEIRGAYTLVNKTTAALDTIQLGSEPGAAFGEVRFNRPAAGVLTDSAFGFRLYALKAPLQPGDSLQVDFVVHHKQNGFRHRNTKPLVVANGTFFTNYDLLPAIGYQRFREIQDAYIRKNHQLAARPVLPSLYEHEARRKPFSADQTTFEAIVGTAKGEVAVAPGVLHSTWEKDGRRYFHYKTNASIGGEYAILSANYQVKESRWKDVTIRIYHHPSHDQNIERMLRSVKASLAYYTAQFGPYPFESFTLVEGAGPGGGASADAGIVYFGEQYAILNPDDSPGGFDLPYYIMAHEMAHQWWGLARLTPAYVEGAGVLIESLSVYSGMQVLEKDYGDHHLQQYVDYLHASYAMPRSLVSASLLQANEEFLYYKKGGLALYALSKYIGKEKVNGALRSLLQKRTTGELPLPTTLDLYQELQQATPDSLHYLLTDLFKENTYWRLKTKQFVAEESKSGDWRVTLKIQAQKVVVDSAGNEEEVPMHDWLEVGLYEEGKGLSEPLYLRMHRVRSGEQLIKMTVPRKPESGGIDPNKLMIDLRLDDNMRQEGD